MPKKILEDHMVCSAKIVINKDRGIVGIFGPDVYTDYDINEDFEPENEVIVEIEVSVPFSLFEPMKMKVEVPKDFRTGSVHGEIEKVEIPIELAEAVSGRSDSFEVSMDNGPTGLVAAFTRKVSSAMDKMRTKEELAQADEARKKKAKEALDKRIAELQKMKEEL